MRSVQLVVMFVMSSLLGTQLLYGVKISVLSDAIRQLHNEERNGTFKNEYKNVSRKTIIKFIEIMKKHRYIGEEDLSTSSVRWPEGIFRK